MLRNTLARSAAAASCKIPLCRTVNLTSSRPNPTSIRPYTFQRGRNIVLEEHTDPSNKIRRVGLVHGDMREFSIELRPRLDEERYKKIASDVEKWLSINSGASSNPGSISDTSAGSTSLATSSTTAHTPAITVSLRVTDRVLPETVAMLTIATPTLMQGQHLMDQLTCHFKDNLFPAAPMGALVDNGTPAATEPTDHRRDNHFWHAHNLVKDNSASSHRSDYAHHGTSTLSLLATHGSETSGLLKFGPHSEVHVIAVKSADPTTAEGRRQDFKAGGRFAGNGHTLMDGMELAREIIDLAPARGFRDDQCIVGINVAMPLCNIPIAAAEMQTLAKRGIPIVAGAGNIALPAQLGLAGGPGVYGIGAFGPDFNQILSCAYGRKIFAFAPGGEIFTAAARGSEHSSWYYSVGKSYAAPIALAMTLVEHDRQPTMMAALHAVRNRALHGRLQLQDYKCANEGEEIAGRGFTGRWPTYVQMNHQAVRRVVCDPGATPNLAMVWPSSAH
ncbi:hypothetical protein LTR56_027555 [Elasticomyces elasticus]|nr:hypothetical protein LTR56_027555 [Elasticomyces elasticus]KAK4897457.1 hypothetical protein LTR49_027996 [Elasticomyces elasticus]